MTHSTDPLVSSIALALSRVPYSRVEDLGLSAPDAISLPDEKWIRLGGYDNPSTAIAHRKAMIEKATEEAQFIKAKKLSVLTPIDPGYPRRLLVAPVMPRMLTICGHADLDADRMLSVVGTRMATPYGINFTERLIAELKETVDPVTIVSGLAYGIDATAHRAALKNDMPTIAVVAHGLGMIYPASHRDLASRIIKADGAIISTYLHAEQPFRSHFLERNVLIASLSDATLVAESDIKGGAMSTAAHALDAGRDVLALPGRHTDKMSSGCNHLIRTRRAELVTCAKEVIDTICWKIPTNKKPPLQMAIFPALSPIGEKIAAALRERNEPVSLDELTITTGIPIHKLLSETAEMEFNGHLLRYPGGRIMLCV